VEYDNSFEKIWIGLALSDYTLYDHV